MQPRVVIVTRQDEITSLRNTYGTVSNASYALSTRGGSIAEATTRSEMYTTAVGRVTVAIPEDWRQARVMRDQLDRFLFEPDDIIAVVGQDGLVANVAKYLHNKQVVIGFNDNKTKNPGVLVKHDPGVARAAFVRAQRGDASVEKRTMVRVTLDDGQELTALNEIYIGHQSHQSSRYTIEAHGNEEKQSSSGIIVSTGTGTSGWCSSILRSWGWELDDPREAAELLVLPTDPELIYMVREAWLSPATGTDINWGYIKKSDELIVTSEMEEGGVIFGDGMETDHIFFDYGRVATVTVSDNYLRLL